MNARRGKRVAESFTDDLMSTVTSSRSSIEVMDKDTQQRVHC